MFWCGMDKFSELKFEFNAKRHNFGTIWRLAVCEFDLSFCISQRIKRQIQLLMGLLQYPYQILMSQEKMLSVENRRFKGFH